MKTTLLTSFLALTFLLTACGNKGPLTLPPPPDKPAKLADHTSAGVPK